MTASGAVIGFRATVLTALGVTSEVVATVAGGLAVWALLPRVGTGVGLLELRNRYLTQPAAVTKLVLLDTHLQTRGSDETALISKAWRLRAAAVTLAVAVAIAVTGSIVSYLDERSGNEQQRSPAPAASTGPRATVSPGP